MRGIQEQIKLQILPVCMDSESVCRDYGEPGLKAVPRQEKRDFKAEREKMKEALLPFVRETVKKQLKEEREYYRSRPSLAARQMESVLGQGQLVPILAGQVCERVERQLRLERIRKAKS